MRVTTLSSLDGSTSNHRVPEGGGFRITSGTVLQDHHRPEVLIILRRPTITLTATLTGTRFSLPDIRMSGPERPLTLVFLLWAIQESNL